MSKTLKGKDKVRAKLRDAKLKIARKMKTAALVVKTVLASFCLAMVVCPASAEQTEQELAAKKAEQRARPKYAFVGNSAEAKAARKAARLNRKVTYEAVGQGKYMKFVNGKKIWQNPRDEQAMKADRAKEEKYRQRHHIPGDKIDPNADRDLSKYKGFKKPQPKQ